MHVTDASRSVGVVGKLLNENKIEELVTSTREDYSSIREAYLSSSKKRSLLTIDDARDRKFSVDWDKYIPPKPKFSGIEILKDYPITNLVDYIDWTPFFHTWEMRGKFPDILENGKYGNEPQKLFDDANELLDQLINDKQLTADAIFGIYPAISKDEKVSVDSYTFNFPRQLIDKGKKKFNYSLADFISPNEDYIGLFAVTAGKGIEQIISEYENELDDYKIIMVKAIADRLPEAFAEKLHQMIRTDYWGYSIEKEVNINDLIKENYDGIRPAPGYPACPDHAEKDTIWKILNVEENIGITLTENRAMYPAASVCGWYFSHPESCYFSVLRNE